MKTILTFTLAFFPFLSMFGQEPSGCNIHFESSDSRLSIPQNKIAFVCFMADSLRRQENAFRHEKGAHNEHLVTIIVEKSQVQELVSGDTDRFGQALFTLLEESSTEDEYALVLSEDNFKVTETEVLALLCNQLADLYFNDSQGEKNSTRGLELQQWTGGRYEELLKEKGPDGKSLLFSAMSYFDQSKYVKTPTAKGILWARDLFVNSFTLMSLQQAGYLDSSGFNPPSPKSQQYWQELNSKYKPFIFDRPVGLKW
jgi:hypothetical protein